MRAAARSAHVCTQQPTRLVSEAAEWLAAYLAAPENAATASFTLAELLTAARMKAGGIDELMMRQALWRSNLAQGRRAQGNRERAWFRPRPAPFSASVPTPEETNATRAVVDLRAFSDVVPSTPPADADDATFFALCARADMVELTAACTLARQLRAGNFMPQSLGRTLITLERMLRQKIRASITDHDKAGGTDTAQLIVELNAISVVSS